MTTYESFRNDFQVAAALTVGSRLAAIFAFAVVCVPSKHDVLVLLCLLLPSLLFATTAVMAWRIAQSAWADYYVGGAYPEKFQAFIRELREWRQHGYRTPFEIQRGIPSRTKPPRAPFFP